jgi:hypothetical protein
MGKRNLKNPGQNQKGLDLFDIRISDSRYAGLGSFKRDLRPILNLQKYFGVG